MSLFSLSFWFNLRPGLLSPATKTVFLAFLAVIAVCAVVFFILKKNPKNPQAKLWNSLYGFSLSNFIIGLALWFLNYELVPFLSARFWFLLWLISMIVWAGLIFKGLFCKLKRKEEAEKEKAFKKYLP